MTLKTTFSVVVQKPMCFWGTTCDNGLIKWGGGGYLVKFWKFKLPFNHV